MEEIYKASYELCAHCTVHIINKQKKSIKFGHTKGQ